MEWSGYTQSKVKKKHNFNEIFRDFAIYFDSFKINDYGNNYYCRLINNFYQELLTRKVIIATINYDCLLEYAFMQAGINEITYQGLSNHPILLKLHGSCNFIPQNFTGDISNGLKIIRGQSKIETSCKFCAPGKVKENLKSVPISPAMSLFIKDKTDTVCMSFIKKIREQYNTYVQSASIAVSIGVRPNEVDHHVWDPLKTIPKLFLVAGEEDCKNWCQQNSNSKFLGTTFKDTYLDIINIIKSNI